MKQILFYLMGATLVATIIFGIKEMVEQTFISFAIFGLLTAARIAISKLEDDMSWFGRLMIFCIVAVSTVVVSIFLPDIFGWK